MKGLVIRSWPMLEPAPWPQMKPTSSPSGSSFSLIELISVAWLPPGRSVRPTEPLNKTSPTWAKRNSLLKNTTLPGEWPGQCRMSKVRSPISTWSPSSSQRSGPKLRTPVMPKRSPLLTTLSSRYLSAICGPSIFTCSASRKSAAPPTWSIWPCVSQIFSTVTPVCLIASKILGTSPPGSITTAFFEGSCQMMVQFCSNSVTGTIIAPALAWFSAWFSVLSSMHGTILNIEKGSTCGEPICGPIQSVIEFRRRIFSGVSRKSQRSDRDFGRDVQFHGPALQRSVLQIAVRRNPHHGPRFFCQRTPQYVRPRAWRCPCHDTARVSRQCQWHRDPFPLWRGGSDRAQCTGRGGVPSRPGPSHDGQICAARRGNCHHRAGAGKGRPDSPRRPDLPAKLFARATDPDRRGAGQERRSGPARTRGGQRLRYDRTFRARTVAERAYAWQPPLDPEKYRQCAAGAASGVGAG